MAEQQAVTFVDELPEGELKRRTAWSPVVDAVKANPGRWAQVRSYDTEAEKTARKASELRSQLKKVGEEHGLEFEVRTPSATQVLGFLRAPAQD